MKFGPRGKVAWYKTYINPILFVNKTNKIAENQEVLNVRRDSSSAEETEKNWEQSEIAS